MRKRIDYILEKKMDSAIITLSIAFSQSGKNEKPVILHSINVGMALFNHGYDEDTIISGILHDILEDTGYGVDKLTDEYGKTVASIVKATSFNAEIENSFERNEDVFKRCKATGKSALTVKCADLIDNMPYISLVEEKNLYNLLVKKYHCFIRYSETIKDEPIFREYLEMHKHYVPIL